MEACFGTWKRTNFILRKVKKGEGSFGFELKMMYMHPMQVPFQVPLEVNIVLVGFNGDGGYRYMLDSHKLEEFMKSSFPSHRPACMETGELIDVEHHIIYNAFHVSFLRTNAIEN